MALFRNHINVAKKIIWRKFFSLETCTHFLRHKAIVNTGTVS